MENNNITNELKYIGVNDYQTKLFESQYIIPNGISYNSYLLKSEKNIIFDTVDEIATSNWYKNMENYLNGESVDYLIVTHLEPDHGYNIKSLADKYPNMKIVGNQTTFKFMAQFFNINNLDERKIVVKENDTLTIGKYNFRFIMASMVHWPEVMMVYNENDKILFTADAFGKFGALDCDEDWLCEARRYYFNIVGKYGAQVQNLLKKVANLNIKVICPLHGPILSKNLSYYIDKYNIWSKYLPEDEGVFIAYASIHGNTAYVSKKVADILKRKGVKNIVLGDLVNDDMAEAIENAFRYDKIILAASSYNGEVFPPMEHFLNHLRGKNFQNRKIAIIENGTWAPSAAKIMLDIINKIKDIKLCKNIVTIKSSLKDDDIPALENIVNELLNC